MNQKAFTLIELLVVVLIIGILAAIASPQYQKAVEKARIAGAISVIKTVSQGVDLYLLENGYPQNYTGPGNSTQSEYDILWCMDSNLRHLELPIDMKGIYHCDSSGWPTDSNFFYDAVCNNWGCYIDAYRTFGAYNSEDSYFLGMYRPASTNQWESYCYYFDNAGERACSTLRGQGSWQIYDGNE